VGKRSLARRELLPKLLPLSWVSQLTATGKAIEEAPLRATLARGRYFFGSIRAAPAAGATMLSWPSSQRTR
jgi:hypothetical protein